MFLIDLHLTHLSVVLLVLFDVQGASAPVYVCLSCVSPETGEDLFCQE